MIYQQETFADTLSRAFLPEPPDEVLEEKFEITIISTYL